MGEEARGRQAQPSAEVENDYLSADDKLKAQEERGKKVGAAKRTGRHYDIPEAVTDAYNMPVINESKLRLKKLGARKTNKRQFPEGI